MDIFILTNKWELTHCSSFCVRLEDHDTRQLPLYLHRIKRVWSSVLFFSQFLRETKGWINIKSLMLFSIFHGAREVPGGQEVKVSMSIFCSAAYDMRRFFHSFTVTPWGSSSLHEVYFICISLITGTWPLRNSEEGSHNLNMSRLKIPAHLECVTNEKRLQWYIPFHC